MDGRVGWATAGAFGYALSWSGCGGPQDPPLDPGGAGGTGSDAAAAAAALEATQRFIDDYAAQEMCVRRRVGNAGDGPCQEFSLPPGPDQFTCAEGLYCSYSENRCVKFAGAGEPCRDEVECAPDTICKDGACRGLPGTGEPCLLHPLYSPGLCQRGIRCDEATLVCGTPLLLTGEACQDDAECSVSRKCVRGKCNDWPRAIHCTNNRG